MDIKDCLEFCRSAWSEGGVALEGLKSVIRIPNLSPEYDVNFLTNGLIQKTVATTKAWIESLELKDINIKVYADEGRQPLLMATIKGAPNSENVLTYGHLDKMPHLDPAKWSEGLSATNPVVRGDKLYGRGSNDDSYNPFLIFTSIKYLQSKGLPHPNMTIILETGEESGDEEITRYFNELFTTIGKIDFIFILDGACMDYEHFWCCSSLRGFVGGILSVEHLSSPCHSGMATGLVPSTFRIIRQLLSRIEDEKTGEILLKEANLPEISQTKLSQIDECVETFGDHVLDSVVLLPGAKPLKEQIRDQIIYNTCKPGLAVTGCDGVPCIAEGSNVMRTRTALKLSLRIPPGIKAENVSVAMKETLEKDPPYNAKVTYTPLSTGTGWECNTFKPKIQDALYKASNSVFGSNPLFYGEGASIPLTSLLAQLWPESQIMVTGCAGLDSNPHGYDESLDLPYTIKFTAAFAQFLNEYAK
ncbi:peptidase M20 [Histomonas meleagridis]|uniref:peptidase M20 n=1 Tax=Histomonas meleagridis TaxID=135588 RepID=UPI003559D86D|nr:peptidase M20 [Histomonas meleagridis]KAH0805459.1 peptidase M20 [Histomonas meleagridis]